MTAYLLFALGAGMLGVILYDFISTVLTVTGSGPLTGRLNAFFWKLQRRLHHRWPSHRRLSCAGPALAVGSLLLWAAALWLAWTLIFASSPGAIVDAKTEQPADTVTRAYYVGYTLTTLGLGDYKPGSGGWRIATVLAAANGLFLFTMAITYIIPVVSAVADKRRLAALIDGLGDTPADIVIQGYRDDRFAALQDQLITLTPMVAAIGQRHLAYPILHYFHSPEAATALPARIARLDETVSVLADGVAAGTRPPTLALAPLRRALDGFVGILDSAHIDPAPAPPPAPALAALRGAGIRCVDDARWHAALAERALHRRRLLGLVHADAWGWSAVTRQDPAPAAEPASGPPAG